jgi:hypothetical protein
MCTCEDGEPNATRSSPMPGRLVSDPQMKFHILSLKMGATSVSSQADPDILMTDPCSHRVSVCDAGEPNATHSSPMPGQLVREPPNDIIHIPSLKMDTTF